MRLKSQFEEFDGFRWLSRIKSKWQSYVRYNLQGLVDGIYVIEIIIATRKKKTCHIVF